MRKENNREFLRKINLFSNIKMSKMIIWNSSSYLITMSSSSLPNFISFLHNGLLQNDEVWGWVYDKVELGINSNYRPPRAKINVFISLFHYKNVHFYAFSWLVSAWGFQKNNFFRFLNLTKVGKAFIYVDFLGKNYKGASVKKNRKNSV